MSALPKIRPCPKCGDRDQISVYAYDSGATYVECTMECGYRGKACTTARWAIRHHNNERDERARSYIQDREAALAEMRERLEKKLLPLREDLANACSSETIVRRYQVQWLDDILAALSTQESSAALAGDGKEVAR